MNKKTIVLAIALTLVLVFGAVSQTPSGPKHHVVFQLTEPEGDAWDTIIAHVNNLKKAFANDGGAQVEVVFYGPGLNMLRKTSKAHEEDLKKLAGEGVTLAACQNAMRHFKLKSEDLFPFVTEVDSGVAELARKQEAGWAYIH